MKITDIKFNPTNPVVLNLETIDDPSTVPVSVHPKVSKEDKIRTEDVSKEDDNHTEVFCGHQQKILHYQIITIRHLEAIGLPTKIGKTTITVPGVGEVTINKLHYGMSMFFHNLDDSYPTLPIHTCHEN